MLERLYIICLLFITTFVSKAGTTDTRSAKIGDEIHVYTTSHAYTQGVLWNWDSSVLELQGTLYSTSTSATFKIISLAPSAGSIIQAITYYYKDNTTSSGVNKDVDVWKIFTSGSDDDPGEDNYDRGVVRLNYNSLQLAGDDYVDLVATVYNGASNIFNWSSSNPSSVAVSTTGNNVARIIAKLPGTATIRVSIENGNYADCIIEVTEKNQIKYLDFILNDDNTSYSVKRKDGLYPKGQLTIPSHYNGFPITKIANGGFSYFSGLEIVILPSTLTEIGEQAFRSCHSLTRVDIPVSVKVIGEFAFNYCKKLQSISIPPLVTRIENSTFYYCESLSSFVIHDNITSIEDMALAGCSNISTIDIPKSVVNIGFGAFSCENLKKIYVHWDSPLACKRPFLYEKLYDKVILYTPSDCVDSYRNAEPWKRFINIMGGDYTDVQSIFADEIIDYAKPYLIFNIAGQTIGQKLDQLPSGMYIVKQGLITNKIFK